jgi:hypothetical protein
MSPRSRTGAAALCAGVALMAGVASALGVFARGGGTVETVTSARGVTYEMVVDGIYAYNAQRVVAEGIGWDIFTLLVAVPAMLLAAVLVARGSLRGRVFAAGLLGYFFYQYLEYSVTWAFGPLFLLFVVIFASSLAGMVWLGVDIARYGIHGHFRDSFPGRPWAVLSVALASLLTLLWLQRIATALGGDLAAAGLKGETTLTIQALDLGLLVPASLFIAVLTWRRNPYGYVLAASFVVTFVAMASAIVGMLLSAWAAEGALEVAPVAIFGFAALAAVALGIRMYGSAAADAGGAIVGALTAAAPSGRVPASGHLG